MLEPCLATCFSSSELESVESLELTFFLLIWAAAAGFDDVGAFFGSWLLILAARVTRIA